MDTQTAVETGTSITLIVMELIPVAVIVVGLVLMFKEVFKKK